jgi:hypothetical protein
VSFHDVDEFISFSHREFRGKKKKKKIEAGLQKMKQPGYILDRLNAIKDEERKYYVTSQNISSGNISSNNTIKNNGSFSCVTIGRVRYNAKEFSTIDESLQQLKAQYKIPDFVDPKRFDTLRYKHITQCELWKSVIDLSQQGYVRFHFHFHFHFWIRVCVCLCLYRMA